MSELHFFPTIPQQEARPRSFLCTILINHRSNLLPPWVVPPGLAHCPYLLPAQGPILASGLGLTPLNTQWTSHFGLPGVHTRSLVPLNLWLRVHCVFVNELLWIEIFDILRCTSHRSTTVIARPGQRLKADLLHDMDPVSIGRETSEKSPVPSGWRWLLCLECGRWSTPVWYHFLACDLRQVTWVTLTLKWG